MLRCISRYRNEATRLNVEPGELIRDLSEDAEALLLRDSPGSFELVAEAKGLDAPPVHRMVEREVAMRKESERRPGELITRETFGAVRPRRR